MSTTDPRPHTHGWYGSCDPAHYVPRFSRFHTFSVSCFEWLPKAKGGVKRGPCKVRVSGSIYKPEAVYSKANEICGLLDLNQYEGPKNVRL